MPTLYVLSGPDLGKSFDVAEGALMGRAEDCAVVLHAGSVSRHHARLEREGAGWVVVDLDSRNGVFLDDERSPRAELRDGAVFRLGDLELRFREQAGAQRDVASSAPAAAEDETLEFRDELEFDEPDEPVADLVGGVEIELENEEALDAAPPPTATAPPAEGPGVAAESAGASAREPGAAAREPSAEAEEPSAEARQRRAAALERAGARAALASDPAATATRSAAGGALQDAGRPVLRYSREVDRSGFFAADLEQYPLWVRFAAALLALALFAGIFWVAFRGVGFLKAKQAGAPSAVEAEFEPGVAE